MGRGLSPCSRWPELTQAFQPASTSPEAGRSLKKAWTGAKLLSVTKGKSAEGSATDTHSSGGVHGAVSNRGPGRRGPATGTHTARCQPSTDLTTQLPRLPRGLFTAHCQPCPPPLPATHQHGDPISWSAQRASGPHSGDQGRARGSEPHSALIQVVSGVPTTAGSPTRMSTPGILPSPFLAVSPRQ